MTTWPDGTENILMVDDEPAMAEFGRLMFTRLGYKVTALTSSRDALDFIRQNPADLDLVFTDLVMPGLDGLELAQAVKDIRPDLPVVLCTGHGEQLDSVNLADLGVRAVILKPFYIRQVAEVIREILDARPAGSALKSACGD